MGVKSHTLTQARKGYDGAGSRRNTGDGTVFYQSGSGKKEPGQSGGLAAATGRGLKRRST